MNQKIGLRIVTTTALAVILGACATSKSVDQKIADAQAQSSKKIESVEGQVEDLQTKQKATDAHLTQTDAALAELSTEAKDALKRAQDAGVLAKGKVVFEQTFKEDRIKFKVNSYELNKDAQAALADFAGKVKALNEQYYIEIQGHTDDTGGRKLNDELGERRADEVRRYLSRSAQLPLNRMSTISYGDSLPVSSNKTRKGRAENRRVVIVVLE
ncbi:MAG TPA: OmpA family protein [Thermoanaerobaculia bacterium]|jgi:outer membrane protein OmpA-like peptidoglycan-associated protein|nr:OmpA family protein [Thermoanaerobaculia bacterium]